MADKLFRLFGWTNAQQQRFYHWLEMLRKVFSGKPNAKRFLAGLLAAAELFCGAVFKAPVHPYGEALDLTGYELILNEEFDGDALDTDVWYYRSLGSGNAGCGFNAESQVQLRNGKMILTAEYLDEDHGAYGAGWYSAAVALNEWHCKGYYEIRCICSKGNGFWSAFWLQSSHSYDSESRGGVGGAEIDILEATDYDARLPSHHNSITQTVYCNGYDTDDEKIDKCQFSVVGDDIYNQYNTYGVLWTDEEYVFFVNGVESARTSFGHGTSAVPENLIVSLEIPQELPAEIADNPAYRTEMIVDYVRVYQLP